MSSTMPYRAGEMTEGYKDMPSFLVGCTSEKGERVGNMIFASKNFGKRIEEMVSDGRGVVVYFHLVLVVLASHSANPLFSVSVHITNHP